MRLWWLLILAALAVPVRAQEQTPELGAITQRWLDAALAQDQGALPLRMEVSVGQLDPRLRLAPCARVEPHLPAGARLWGRTRLGLRCVEGAVRWNVYLPITVKAFGPAWVLAGGVFVAETLSVAAQVLYFKFTGGKRIFRMAPLHHHFELGGWKETQVVVRFWIITIMLVLVGLSTLKIR